MATVDPKWIRTASDEAAAHEGCWFDERAAVKVVEFFSKFLRHSKGKHAGKPFDLLDWQIRELIYPVFGWKRPDGLRRIRNVYTEIPKKNGKALAISTPVPTPDGWKKHGDIRPGDRVFGSDGKPTFVVACSEVWLGEPCYRVTFSDGESIVAHANHEWETTAYRNGGVNGRHDNPAFRSVRSTEEIRRTLKFNASRTSVACNHRVALCCPVECREADLPIPPYTLGVWLGDGHSGQSRLTFDDADQEIAAGVMADGFTLRQAKKQGRASTWAVTKGKKWAKGSLQSTLRSVGVLDNKHIPPAYLRASVQQRMELLRGLMDTDGSAVVGPSNAACEFSTTIDAIRDGAMELIRSLGYKPTCRTVPASCNGKRCKDVHRIQFMAFKSTSPFRLSRKTDRLKASPTKSSRSQYRQIVAVDPVESVPTNCIQVDNSDGIYLAGKGFVPTHNSTLLSGIGLYMLVGDGEAGAEIYDVATSRDQANIIHNEAINMVRNSPALSEALKVNLSTKNIAFERNMSFYRPLTADPNTNQGQNSHCLLMDELHAWPGTENWEALKYAGRSRTQPLRWAITTAGNDELSICWQQHQYAKGVIDGSISDTRYHAFIAAADTADDWKSPEVWRKANPSIGHTFSEEDFAADAAEAEKQPSTQASFKRYSLNIWQTSTQPWLKIEDWQRCYEPVEIEQFEDRECYAGLDLASTSDTTSLVLVFRDGVRYVVFPYFWLPSDVAFSPDAPPEYRAWADAGWLLTTPGNVTDYGFIKRFVGDLNERYPIRELAYDPWHGEQLTQEIEAEHAIHRVKFPQSIGSFSEPTKDVERMILATEPGAERIVHANHPVMRWQIGNVAIKEDHNANIRPVKPERKSRRKIDGVVAMIMAIARAKLSEGDSIYNTEGVFGALDD